MSALQLSVRQMGPAYARGIARHTRMELDAPAQALFADAIRAMKSRIGLKLRRAEVQRIASRFLEAARKIAIAPIVRGADLAFTAIVPYVELGTVRIGRFDFAAPETRRGGYRVSIRGADLVNVSRHALERLHLRLSTARWSELAPALAVLARMDRIAAVARSVELRWMWLPSGTEGAFVLAFGDRLPVVVSYLDTLSHPRAALLAPVSAWLAQPAADDATLELVLRRPEFDLWRSER